MRIGSNPNNHKVIDFSSKSHRVIIPIYIPNAEGYFKDAFNVLKVCIESLLKTINNDTAITLISNASSKEVNDYLTKLFEEKKIDKVVFNSENIGKMNAIITETRASFEEFITYSDADVFFDKGWLKQTFEIFKNFPKAGFVSMNPMPKSYGHSSSAILDNILILNSINKKISDYCEYSDLEHFHKSIAREAAQTKLLFNQDALVLNNKNFNCFVGAGHFCCTIRKTPTLKYVPKEESKIGVSGGSEGIYLDIPFEKTSLWRVSSTKAYVWHMGNILEKEWANLKLISIANFNEDDFSFNAIYKDNFYFSKLLPYALKLKIVALLKKINII